MITPYNPQHIEVVEQNNQTILEAAREMFHDQDLLMHLRAEESRTGVYVENLTPHQVLKNKNLEEDFSG